MNEREIKRYLNRPVRFTNPKIYLTDAKYILSGAVFRLGEHGYYYQAELTDITMKNSVMYVSLDEIEVDEDEHKPQPEIQAQR